jgi:adenylylsulfate kinase
MTESLLPVKHQLRESLRRSAVKTISYRLVILILDFVCVYLFSGKIKVALGFTIVSNVYTTVCYFLHERIWNKIKWGKIAYKNET